MYRTTANLDDMIFAFLYGCKTQATAFYIAACPGSRQYRADENLINSLPGPGRAALILRKVSTQ
jgi:hypothetical protein